MPPRHPAERPALVLLCSSSSPPIRSPRRSAGRSGWSRSPARSRRWRSRAAIGSRRCRKLARPRLARHPHRSCGASSSSSPGCATSASSTAWRRSTSALPDGSGRQLGVVGVGSALGSALVDNHPMSILNMMALGAHGGSRPLLAALVGGDIGPRLLPDRLARGPPLDGSPAPRRRGDQRRPLHPRRHARARPDARAVASPPRPPPLIWIRWSWLQRTRRVWWPVTASGNGAVAASRRAPPSGPSPIARCAMRALYDAVTGHHTHRSHRYPSDRARSISIRREGTAHRF